MVCMKLQTEGENKKRGEIQTGGGEREGDDVGGGGGYGRRTEGVVNKKGNGGGENDRGKGRGRGRKRDVGRGIPSPVGLGTMKTLLYESRLIGFEGYNVNYNYGGYNYRRNTYGSSKYVEQRNVWPLSYNQLKLPLLLGVFDSEEYLDWQGRVEALFFAYGIFEEHKVQLVTKSFTSSVLAWWKYIREHSLRNGSTPIISWESLKRDLRDKFGILDYQEVETPVSEFCDPLCKKSDYVYMEEKYEKGSNGRRSHEMLKEEQIKKA
ncbi:hypothetical protein M9H77_30665 [Catharanthus roseus]|uniref:Uncharacterized protein n=1 Tax=Catharanthus roseus TaxID=4058 RepID=A0ACC0A051_CATRO|nr:hypothetical protein M9H77_30665 [Catharanthus roseus]